MVGERFKKTKFLRPTRKGTWYTMPWSKTSPKLGFCPRVPLDFWICVFKDRLYEGLGLESLQSWYCCEKQYLLWKNYKNNFSLYLRINSFRSIFHKTWNIKTMSFLTYINFFKMSFFSYYWIESFTSLFAILDEDFKIIRPTPKYFIVIVLMKSNRSSLQFQVQFTVSIKHLCSFGNGIKSLTLFSPVPRFLKTLAESR